MILRTIKTGSSGNCHILETSKHEKLLLDCGATMQDIKKGLNWDLEGLRGALVTHKHLDHSLSKPDLEAMGIPVFGYDSKSKESIPEFGEIQWFPLLDLNSQWTHTNSDGSPCPCYGFLIEHEEMGSLLYITDTSLVKWRFKGVNHILLGVNYDASMVSGSDAKDKHVLRGHMSIQTACNFVKANASKDLLTVAMCHLSEGNADPDKFVDMMRRVAPDASILTVEPQKEIALGNTRCPF